LNNLSLINSFSELSTENIYQTAIKSKDPGIHSNPILNKELEGKLDFRKKQQAKFTRMGGANGFKIRVQ
jgi:hypothetical protein